ncbi:phosphotransferase enzyme family protein [Muricoccus pecuniae]|uniref:Ser/Thr protein kinase RdoA (MazF antagonist) n=1 Tax=Muricoccus pecuniae TaxID=693023 RepID=A0A840Y8L0_9PROT|nr:phosphotransferase [Roseomonas pecuniae]MBB5696496.1 Ser/Thr protein kinase RdoA (MazF antagonist) [Roseomonas pecuniae]
MTAGTASVWAAGDWHWEANGAAALPLYGLPADAPLTLLSFSENAVYRVDLPEGERRILRLHRPGYRTGEEIGSELSLIATLRDNAVLRSPAVLPTLAGEPIGAFGTPGRTQLAVLFEFVPGAPPDETRLPQAFLQLGSVAARLHAHAAGWTPPPGFVRPDWDVDTAIGPQGMWGCWRDNPEIGEAARAVLEAADAKLRREIAAYGRPEGRWGLIHGDMRLANILVDAAGPCLIDFDDCGFGWHLYELACACSFIEQREDLDDIVAAWLRGYRAVRPLDPADLAAAPAMLLLRRLLLVGWFATHTHSAEACALAPGFVADSVAIARRYLADGYLRRGLAA